MFVSIYSALFGVKAIKNCTVENIVFKQALAVIADIWSLYATKEVKVYSTNKLSKVSTARNILEPNCLKMKL